MTNTLLDLLSLVWEQAQRFAPALRLSPPIIRGRLLHPQLNLKWIVLSSKVERAPIQTNVSCTCAVFVDTTSMHALTYLIHVGKFVR